MPFLAATDRMIQWLGRAALAVSGTCVVVLMLMGSIDTIGTHAFGQSIPSSHESQEAFEAVLIFCALAAVQQRRAHIVIDLATSLMGPRLRRISEIVAMAVTTGFFGLLTWQAWALAARSIAAGELSPGYVSFPLYLFKALFFAGCLIALLEALRQLAHLVLLHRPATGATVAATHF